MNDGKRYDINICPRCNRWRLEYCELKQIMFLYVPSERSVYGYDRVTIKDDRNFCDEGISEPNANTVRYTWREARQMSGYVCHECGRLLIAEIEQAIASRDKRKRIEEDEDKIRALTIKKLESEIRREKTCIEILNADHKALQSIVERTAVAPYEGWGKAMEYVREKNKK